MLLDWNATWFVYDCLLILRICCLFQRVPGVFSIFAGDFHCNLPYSPVTCQLTLTRYFRFLDVLRFTRRVNSLMFETSHETSSLSLKAEIYVPKSRETEVFCTQRAKNKTMDYNDRYCSLVSSDSVDRDETPFLRNRQVS